MRAERGMQALGYRFDQGHAHIVGLGEAALRIDGQGALEEHLEGQVGALLEASVPARRPAEGPAWQGPGEVLVQDQRHGEAVALVGRATVGLLGGDVARGAEVVDGRHAALNLEADAEIAQGDASVGKEEDVVRRHVAVDSRRKQRD